jgi:hypothetical protein
VEIIENSVTESYVVHNATLKCSLGTTSSKLTIPIGHGVFIYDKKQANVSDIKSIYNINSFGNCLCASPPPPCIPAVSINWLNGKENVIIDKHNALLNTSIAVCSLGGIISIIDDGQL